MILEGSVDLNALGWHEGLTEWKPLNSFLPAQQHSAAPTKPGAAPLTYTENRDASPTSLRQGRQLQDVHASVKQGAIIGGWVFLILGVVTMYLSMWTFVIYGPLFIIVIILSIVAMSLRRILGGIALLLTTLILPTGLSLIHFTALNDKPGEGITKQRKSEGYAAPIISKASEKQIFYQTFDQKASLRFITSDELEFREGGTIMLCKYSRQGNSLRVVVSGNGRNEVLYLEATKNGFAGKGFEVEGAECGIPEVYNHGFFSICTIQVNPDEGMDAITFVQKYLPKNDPTIRIRGIKDTELVQIGVFADDKTTAANRANGITETIAKKSIEDRKASTAPKLARLQEEVDKQRSKVEALRKEAAAILLKMNIQDSNSDSLSEFDKSAQGSGNQDGGYYTAKKNYIDSKNILEAAVMRLSTETMELKMPQQVIIIWERADVGTR